MMAADGHLGITALSRVTLASAGLSCSLLRPSVTLSRQFTCFSNHFHHNGRRAVDGSAVGRRSCGRAVFFRAWRRWRPTSAFSSYLLIQNYMLLLKIRDGRRMRNMVTNVSTKSNYDRLRINKALGIFESDNGNDMKKNLRSDWSRVQKLCRDDRLFGWLGVTRAS